MIPRSLAVIAVALTLCVGLIADAATVKDMLGRDVAVRPTTARIVSLVPSVTETLYAIGADPLLVGVTTFCDFPPAATSKAKVGGLVNPSLEAIASLRPDLVIATTEGNRETTIQQLEAVGLPVYVVRPKTFETVLDTIARLGHLTGRETEAERLAADMTRRAARVVDAVKGRVRPRVLYVVWTDPLVVPGRDTLLTELITMAGGDSVSAREAIEWPRLSLEYAVTMAPDVVVTGAHTQARLDEALRRWRAHNVVLPASRTGRIHGISPDLLHRPGPRIVDGLEALARVIHPGALP